MGLHRAGFEVVGFDVAPQPRYPFEFHQQDALTVDLSGFDAVWASPPCQGYSIMQNLPWLRGRKYPLLILPAREMLDAIGKPYIIENVMGARYGAKGLKKRSIEAHGMQAGWLCGGMFGLPFYRHRLFEANWFWMQPGHPKHRNRIRPGRSLAGRARDFVYSEAEDARGAESWPGRRTADVGFSPRPRGTWEKGFEKRHPGESLQALQNGAQAEGVGIGHAKGWRRVAEAMGIDWMKREELTQAIPPAYSEYLGRALAKALVRQEA